MRIVAWAAGIAVALVQLAAAQEAPSPRARLERLEVEAAALRSELDAVRRERAEAPTPEVPPEAPPAALPAAPAPVAPSPPAESTYPLGELQGEMKKLAWTKGDFKIVPYGILWGATVYETQKTIPGDYALWVESETNADRDAWHFDCRSTRFGVDVAGPPVSLFADARVGGKIEFDFQRQIDTENRAGVLFRHAYVEAKNDEYRLLFGQTWEIISPLYPMMIMYVPGNGAGNVGYRRGQLRLERYLEPSDTVKWTLQGSLNTNILNAFAVEPPAVGRESGWPILQGRAAMMLGERDGPDALPIEFGVSGHIGEQVYDFVPPDPNPVEGLSRRTWSLNADLRVPFTKRCGFQAEFFTGENLGAYMAGILQSVDRNTHDTIAVTGGWAEVWYDWTPRLHSHVGYSIDDPLNSDVTVGRTYNDFIFGNLLFDVTKNLNLGLELSYWKTHFATLAPGDSARVEMAVRYFF